MAARLRSVWMHPWDLEDRSPEAVLDFLELHGLNACHLATCYHGGRMLLGTHPRRRVLDHGLGGSYLPLDPSRFPRRSLAPPVDLRWPGWIEPFLLAASARRFPVYAWIVLNHRDGCPPEIHDLCTRNRFGDVYTYALCPSNTEVRYAFAELCRQTEAFGGFAGLQLEGIGYMGYAHHSLHDKAGVELGAQEVLDLSVCCCEACKREPPDVVAVQQDELRLIRAAVRLPLCLRTAAKPGYFGGKSSFTAAQAAGLADSLSLTFFGSTPEVMKKELQSFTREGFEGAVYGGFIFHGPDCRAAEDVARRSAVLREAELDGEICYCAGMANETQWRWLLASEAEMQEP